MEAKNFETIIEAFEYCKNLGASIDNKGSHRASERGYRSTCRWTDRKPYTVLEYSGNFGTGFKILGYNNDRNILGGVMSNRYYNIWYVIK